MTAKTCYLFRLSANCISLLLLIVLICVFTLNYPASAQEDVKSRIFKDVDNLLSQAKAEQAALLSPENFKKAVAKHTAALKDFDKGKNIQKKIAEIKKLLETAVENAKLAQITFSYLLKSRDEAIESKSIEFAKEEFEEAEDAFFDATRTMEKGSINKAKEKAIKAEKLFREAELIAIKVSIIGNVKNQLKKAEDQKIHKYAPATIKRSRVLLAEAETILTSNRSAKTVAKEKAELAEYEVNHAAYLA
ncbi:MAG: hypothetical protein K8R68_04315, partial [Bacteroidales bacterium]|nr:hypothetical protein [Bacteroidales bacterium]